MLTEVQLQLLDALEEALLREADAEKAVGMKAYMKGHFDFMGVPKPARATIQKQHFPGLRLAGISAEAMLHYCWQKNEREWQYLGMDYALAQSKRLPTNMADWEFWLTHKSWWDTVDLLATRGVGPVLLEQSGLREITIENWRHADNLWLNRTCLLFQLHYKNRTDVLLLADLCRQFAPSKAFFLQKAIGWALRHYSRIDDHWVRKFVENNQLPALSKREALRLL